MSFPVRPVTRSVVRVAALCALFAGATFVAPAAAPAAGSSRAVVNVGGSNRVISFNGSISGIGALQSAASVSTISYGGQGVAVCAINGVGNPAIQGECLGESSGRYWSYWRASPGAGGFSYSGGGAGGTSVTDGWVEGWSFGSGPPPFSSFCAVAGCAPPPTDPPPPPPPVTTPATVAPPASAGGSAAATNDTKSGKQRDSGSKKSEQSGKKGDDSPGSDGGSDGGSGDGSASGSGSGSGSGDGGGNGTGRDGQQASGPLVSSSDDGGSPWGIAVAAGAFALLGAGGFAIRKRRRGVTPLD